MAQLAQNPPWWQQQPTGDYGQGAGRFLPQGPVAGGEIPGLQPWSYRVPDVTYEAKYLESEPVSQFLNKKKKKSGRIKQGGEQDGGGGARGSQGPRGRGGRSGPGSQGGSSASGGSGAGPHG